MLLPVVAGGCCAGVNDAGEPWHHNDLLQRLVALTEHISANTNTPRLVFMSKVPQLLRLDRVGGETTHARTKTTQHLNRILPNRPRTWRERSDTKPAGLIHGETRAGFAALASGLRVFSANQSHAQLLHVTTQYSPHLITALLVNMGEFLSPQHAHTLCSSWVFWACCNSAG